MLSDAPTFFEDPLFERDKSRIINQLANIIDVPSTCHVRMTVYIYICVSVCVCVCVCVCNNYI